MQFKLSLLMALACGANLLASDDSKAAEAPTTPRTAIAAKLVTSDLARAYAEAVNSDGLKELRTAITTLPAEKQDHLNKKLNDCLASIESSELRAKLIEGYRTVFSIEDLEVMKKMRDSDLAEKQMRFHNEHLAPALTPFIVNIMSTVVSLIQADLSDKN